MYETNDIHRKFRHPSHPLIRTGFFSWAPEEAKFVLDHYRYPQKRDLKKSGQDQIEVLADMMRRDMWRPYDQIAFAVYQSVPTLLNGHHRTSAQWIAGKHIKWCVVVYPCETPEEVTDLYYTFDTNVRIRSTETVLDAVGAAEALGVMKVTAKSLFDSIPLLLNDFDFTMAGREPVMTRVFDRRIDFMRLYRDEAQLWETALRPAPKAIKRIMVNQGIVAVGMITLQHHPAKAFEFWNGVAKNDGLPRNDPRAVYLAAIQDPHRGGTSQAHALMASVAWNAFYEDRTLKLIKSMDDVVRIYGTPIGKRRRQPAEIKESAEHGSARQGQRGDPDGNTRPSLQG